MAGANPNFDAPMVREALRFAMRMGSPNRVLDKATFHFKQEPTWVMVVDGEDVAIPTPRLDQDGNPFRSDVFLRENGRSPVVLDEVAVEFSIATPEELPVGNFKQTRVELTVLDEEWMGIKDAREVTLQGGDRYFISYEKPVVGLFEMDVHQLVCYARDEK
jgi:hypothetical protein